MGGRTILTEFGRCVNVRSIADNPVSLPARPRSGRPYGSIGSGDLHLKRKERDDRAIGRRQ